MAQSVTYLYLLDFEGTTDWEHEVPVNCQILMKLYSIVILKPALF